MNTTTRHTPYKRTRADLAAALSDLFLLMVALLFGFAGGLLAAEVREPYCPTEDSCAYRYYGPNDYDFGEVTP